MALFRRLRPSWADRAVRTDEDHAPTVPAARNGEPGGPAPASLDPAAVPRCFGPVPNFAGSPLPVVDRHGRAVPGTGIRKFVDALPLPGPLGRNGLGAHLPVAVPDTITWPGCDYYEIGVQEYTQRLHRDLPATRLRGYRQLNLGTDPSGHNTVAPPDRPWHLGPLIRARRGRPVRIKFINLLPTGRAGGSSCRSTRRSTGRAWARWTGRRRIRRTARRRIWPVPRRPGSARATRGGGSPRRARSPRTRPGPG